jgi:hypothetical protein
MKSADSRLVHHLAIAVALKLVVLGVLWWAFVRGERVGIDVDQAAAHIGAPGSAAAMPTTTTGAKP